MISSFSALRFFNALMIFAHHENTIDNPYLVAFGPCAVSFFFILSGFSMCMGYYHKVFNTDFSWKRFMAKRIIRLYPLHLVLLVGWCNCKLIKSWGGGYSCVV